MTDGESNPGLTESTGVDQRHSSFRQGFSTKNEST